MFEWLDSARTAICLLFLTAASIHDIKSREVPNSIWIVFALIGLALTLISLALSGWNRTTILTWLVTAAVTVGLSMALFYLGLFGGADAKALMCLAAAMPTQPSIMPIKPLLEQINTHCILQLPLPISTFNNAVLTASLLAIAILIKNLVNLARNREKIFDGIENVGPLTKIFTLLTGYRVDANKLRSEKHHYIILEEISRGEDGKIKRRLKPLQRLSSEEENNMGKNIPEDLNGKIWVTPGLPFITFITAGFTTATFIGDIIFLAINILIH